MKAEEYKEKLVAEFKETSGLVDKFDEFMKTNDVFKAMYPETKSLVLNQYNALVGESNSMLERIKILGISVD
jgi:phosphomevalonate kinase